MKKTCTFCKVEKPSKDIRYFYDFETDQPIEIHVCYDCLTKLVLEEYYTTDCRSLPT